MFRSQVEYAATNGIPYSTFMGRTPEPGEPLWMPEDRLIVQLWDEFKGSRHECGRWHWEYSVFEDKHLDYDVCPFCAEYGPFYENLREDRDDMYGVQIGYYLTAREED